MKKTVYVLIGPQGSGKTYWTKNILLTYSQSEIIRISQDEQGRGGHKQLFEQCLKQGKSVVIDRMNFNFEQRNRFISIARDLGYDIVFVWFDISKETCLMRLATRKDHPTVSIDADHNSMLDNYFSNFEPPCFNEYDEMLTIDRKSRCKMLDLQNRCHDKRVIVVGDIHGQFDEFISLLCKCGYSSGDVVVATGDLVDRGPKIKETLIWFRNTPEAYSVEGNHDNKLQRYLIGNPVKIGNGLDCTIDQCHGINSTEWAAWLQSLPRIIRLCNINEKPFYVVHAGVDGRRLIENQRAETCLYARYFDGTDFFDSESGIPWWKTLDGSYYVASGHIISEIVQPCKYVYCLDGGACDGGKLRALVIENNECSVYEVNGNDKI